VERATISSRAKAALTLISAVASPLVVP